MACMRFVDKACRTAVRCAPGCSGTLALIALILVVSVRPLSAQVPPDEDWRSLETPHFRVTFPARLEGLARRAGAVAEDARVRLAQAFLGFPDDRVELLLTDHVDASNGFANVAPYRRVTIYARPPVDGFALSYFDDWVDLVVTHELAHIVHLDVTGGLGRILRSVFGRVPSPWPFFPELASPRWVVEGLAVWYESDLTSAGRLHGTYFDMMVRTAALEGRLESIDQASGESPVWPSGERPYVYGSEFFRWLLDRYGADRMADFVEAVGSQWIPYRMNAAARTAFGVSFSEAWNVWREETTTRALALAKQVDEHAPNPPPEALTTHARQALYAKVGPRGQVAYARADGHGDPEIRVRSSQAGAGAGAGAAERRIRTNGLAHFDWIPDGSLVVSQYELEDPYRTYKDLYRIYPGGASERLTRGARLDQPAVFPGGEEAWAVQTVGGGTRLVSVDLVTGEVRQLPALPEGANWSFPAPSPDGRLVAAIRWRLGQWPDLVLLDGDDGHLVEAVTRDAALELAPTWSPDGTLLWISDRSGVPDVYARDPASASGSLRQVTAVATGLGFPTVDPDGRWIYASQYHADGWDLVRLPYDPDSWIAPGAPASRYARAGGAPQGRSIPAFSGGEVTPYHPWSTLRPRYWEPLVLPAIHATNREVLGPFIGATTTAEDLVGRHAFAASAALSTTDAAFDGRLSYVYRGLGSPLVTLSVDQEWDASGPLRARQSEDAPVDLLYIRERQRRASLDLTFLRSTWRRASALAVGGGMVWEDRTLLDETLQRSPDYALSRPSARLADVRATLSTSTVRSHALSISPEDGVSAFVRLRARKEVGVADSLVGREGWDRSYHEARGRMRWYTSFAGPGFADHVLAIQLAAGAARGPGADAFHFEVGGAAGAPEPLTGFSLFGGESLLFPVRGYARGDRFGRNAWAASAEWRFPIALVNRGPGLFPLHLDRLHGAAFVDAGDAWGPDLQLPGYQSPRQSTLVGVGGELRAELLAFFTVPVTLRIGVGAPLVERTRPTAYLRFGAAF